MEFVKVKQKIFQFIGWLSVIIALTYFALLNISLLWGYNAPLGSNFSLWFLVILSLGLVAILHNKSRSLGLWGLGLALYLGLFAAVMFFLGWFINPFP